MITLTQLQKDYWNQRKLCHHKIKEESIDDILEIKSLQLKIDVDTVGENEVKFFDDYKLDLQVGTLLILKPIKL